MVQRQSATGPGRTFSGRGGRSTDTHCPPLAPDDLAVEIVMGDEGGSEFAGGPAVIAVQPGERHGDGGIDYTGTLSPSESGRLTVGISVRPQHPGMVHGYEVELARWV